MLSWAALDTNTSFFPATTSPGLDPPTDCSPTGIPVRTFASTLGCAGSLNVDHENRIRIGNVGIAEAGDLLALHDRALLRLGRGETESGKFQARRPRVFRIVPGHQRVLEHPHIGNVGALSIRGKRQPERHAPHRNAGENLLRLRIHDHQPKMREVERQQVAAIPREQDGAGQAVSCKSRRDMSRRG